MYRFSCALRASVLALAGVVGIAASSSALTAPAAPPAAPLAREVTFTGAGGLVLQGTLLLPSTQSGTKTPAMLLLAGSGPTDRDGSSPLAPDAQGDGLLKQIALRLAATGIATLRYDKRATKGIRRALAQRPGRVKRLLFLEEFRGRRAGRHGLSARPAPD